MVCAVYYKIKNSKLSKSLFFLIWLCTVQSCFFKGSKDITPEHYKVVRFNDSLTIDGNWNKAEWENVEAVELNFFKGKKPEFNHKVQAKIMYDDKYIYVIFKVYDKYVSCLTEEINGPVWQDACVELFFAPDENYPKRYFNLEINGSGVPLMSYNKVARKNIRRLDVEDIRKIEIVGSLPKPVTPEIQEPITWTLEYKIPMEMLVKYAPITKPEKGVTWRANFYKIAHKSSHPHYITWSDLGFDGPEFHRPEYFGVLEFD